MSAKTYPTDSVVAPDGGTVIFTFYAHASLSILYGSHRIYVDPVSDWADWASQPKADVILVTHAHSDHFDPKAIDHLRTSATQLITNGAVAAELDGARALQNGQTTKVDDYLTVRATEAFNYTDAHRDFHPHTGRDNGYLLTLGGLTIFIAGDTEDIESLADYRGVDVAFLPVNQPYTMTVDQAVRAIGMIRPKIFYPYHYGQTDQKTDIEQLKRKVASMTDIRIFPME